MSSVSIPASVLDAMRAINTQLQAHEFRAAQQQLAAIVRDHPQFAEAQRLLAGTTLALGDPAGAERLLRRALEVDPAWSPTYTTLGELLFVRGRVSEAEAVLQRAIECPRPDARAALMLARHYNSTSRPDLALAVAAPFCTGGTVDPELATQHVHALVALGRQAQALELYGALTPANPALAQPFAVALNSVARHREARQVAQQALARGVKTATLCLTYAQSLIAEGATALAESALRDCVELEPHLIEAHNRLAQLVWVRTGDLAQATEMLDRALRRFGNDAALHAAKAAILQGAGEARFAYECLAPLADHPQAPPALLVRAGLAALEFDPPRALLLARRALQRLPDSGPARNLLTAAQLGTGDADEALRNCEALLTRTPDDQYLIALRTTALRLLGDARYEELCDYARDILPLSIEPPPPWTDLASFLTDLTESLNRLHDPQGHALLFQSLRLGTETTGDLTQSAAAPIRALFQAFAAPINRYLEHIGRGSDPLRRRNHGRWRFNGSWSVRLRNHGFHMNHVHPRGWISSAFYLQLPEVMASGSGDEGVLTFGEPGLLTTPALESEFTVRPAVGMLVLFPSYFWHGTVPFASTQPRLTVAFDAVPQQ